MTFAQSLGVGVLDRIDKYEGRSTARASLLQVMSRPELCRSITGDRVLNLVRKSRALLTMAHSARKQDQPIAVTVFAAHLCRQPFLDDGQAKVVRMIPRVI